MVVERVRASSVRAAAVAWSIACWSPPTPRAAMPTAPNWPSIEGSEIQSGFGWATPTWRSLPDEHPAATLIANAAIAGRARTRARRGTRAGIVRMAAPGADLVAPADGARGIMAET